MYIYIYMYIYMYIRIYTYTATTIWCLTSPKLEKYTATYVGTSQEEKMGLSTDSSFSILKQP